MAWYPRLVSLRGAEQRGNLPVCHCEERSNAAIQCKVSQKIATGGKTALAMTEKAPLVARAAPAGAFRSATAAQRRLLARRWAVSEADWGDRALRLRQPLRLTLFAPSPEVNCPAGAREGGLGHCTGEALGAVQKIATTCCRKSRNDTFAAATTFQCGKCKAPGKAGRPRGDEAIKKSSE